MGLDTNGIKFLMACQKQGVSFENTCMIGRQILNTEKVELKENLNGFGFSSDGSTLNSLFEETNGYAEPLLKLLGAKNIDSLDYSAYEGANLLHDMNWPVPSEWQNKYSLVLESGSLEHIFNFPISIKNCMDMVKLNGHLVIITPVNNIMGHGFYQFSPEVFYRVLSPSNGFEIETMLIFEYSHNLKWYAVKDPKQVKQRVELMNSSATYLCIKARRTQLLEVLSAFPQQSDYEDAWEGRENYYSRLARNKDAVQRIGDPANSKKLIKQLLPEFVVDTYRAYVQARKVKFDPKFYTEVDIWNLPT